MCRSGPGAGLRAPIAVPDHGLPGPVGDPEPEDHRPRPRRRRPLRARAPPHGLSTLFHNAHVVVMDDAGTEYEDGWVLMEDGLIGQVGSGDQPEEADRTADLGGAVVTPGLVNTHH